MPSLNQIPTRSLMGSLLERLLPGKSDAVQRMREQILDFVSSLIAQGVLLRGPIGAGKSTIARVIGLLRRAAPLEVAHANRILGDAKFDRHGRLDVNFMPWYVELPLTGLVETLAEVQLFGATKGAYTGATSRRGVFEQASTGGGDKGKEHIASQLTGGVVFLDEIGDLSASLQAKLLPVLSGGVFYRVGGEGQPDQAHHFRGVVITASWRRLEGGLVRPDLLSRLSAYTVEVPGLADRMDDFDDILDSMQRSVIESVRAAIDHATIVETQLDKDFWERRKVDLHPISVTARRQLQNVDWSRHGSLRGLSAALEQMIANGRPVEAVIEELPAVGADQDASTASSASMLERLLGTKSSSEGLAGRIRALEVENRMQLREQLLSDSSSRSKLAKEMKLTDQQLLAQIRELARRRRRTDGDQQ